MLGDSCPILATTAACECFVPSWQHLAYPPSPGSIGLLLLPDQKDTLYILTFVQHTLKPRGLNLPPGQ